VPPRDGRRDFIADGPPEDRGVAGAAAHVTPHRALDRPSAYPVVTERDVLFPRDTDQHTKAVAQRLIEKPQGRDRIRPDGVEPVGRHLSEIAGYDLWVIFLAAVGAETERPIGDSANPELLVADVEELACGAGTTTGGDDGIASMRHVVRRTGRIHSQHVTTSFSIARRMRPRNADTAGQGSTRIGARLLVVAPAPGTVHDFSTSGLGVTGCALAMPGTARDEV
jgi:hypothetical protein